MRKTLILLLIVFVLIVSSVAVATAGPTIDGILKRKELIVGTSATYPPLTFKTKDGRIQGLDIDLARSIADAMSVKLRVEVIPFDELIPALENKRIDMILSCMTITQERNLRIAYPGPYFFSGQSLLTTKDVADGIEGPEDVDNPDFSIALPQGTTTEKMARERFPKATFTTVKSTDEALALLKAKSVKALMADYPYTVVMAIRFRNQGFVSKPPFNKEPIGIGIRQDDPLLMNWLDNFINMIRGDGSLDRLMQRWLIDPAWIADLP
jgi:polar amino acid transport system substrate-binding protein